MIVGGKGEAIEVVVIGERARITVEDAEGSARIYLKHPAKTVALIKELMQVVKAAPQFIPELLNELADKLEGNDVHKGVRLDDAAGRRDASQDSEGAD